MRLRAWWIFVILAVVGVAIPAGQAGAAPSVTVKGSAPGAAQVLLLTPKGRAYKASVAGSGSFTMKGVPSANVKNATLQFVDASGKYLGPAVLKVVKSGKSFKSILGLKSMSKGTLNVGKLKKQLGWYKAAKASAAGTAGVRAADKSGRPKGAGTAGRVRLVSAKVSALSAVHAMATNSCPDGSPKDPAINGTDAGMDLDCDGLPNNIDVDDNGNGSLDILDQSTNDESDKANYTANLSTYSGISAGMSAKLNIHATDAATLTRQIKAALGANPATSIQGSFSIAIFLQERTVAGAAGSTPDAVYVECPGIKWCDATTGTALIQGNMELYDFRNLIDGKPWKSFPSTDFSSGSPAASSTAKSNGMYRFGSGQDVKWAAFFSPNYDGDDVLSVVRANDVILLHSMKGGVDSTLPITISPFFVTTPYLTAVTATGAADKNTAANVGAGYTAVGSDGKMTLSFYRPQRMLLEGEKGETANANFKSQHGLHYGIVPSMASVGGKQYQARTEFGCGGADATKLYTTTSPSFEVQTQAYGPADQDPATDFWPLYDNTAEDAADDQLSFTIDLKSCFETHKPAVTGGGNKSELAGKTVSDLMGFTWDQFVASGNNYIDFSLTGTGAPTTNGYNRSTLTFRVYSPAWNGQAPSGNNNSGNNNSGNNSGGGSSDAPTVVEILVKNGSVGGASPSNVTGCTSVLSAGGSCSGAAASGTVVIDAAGGATGISLDTGNTAPDLVSANACVQTTATKLTCTIASGQGNKKISVVTN
jgi:hypothetical protein